MVRHQLLMPGKGRVVAVASGRGVFVAGLLYEFVEQHAGSVGNLHFSVDNGLVNVWQHRLRVDFSNLQRDCARFLAHL